ncbi:MAG TPA: carbon monoxide dehydrogenase, partial [Intrasporangiaceae bacterium]|nr:carbon monoxide dehydrogenase [Intrasporangiaceae bacterium]
RPAPSPPAPAADDAIDLGATVLPAVARAYAPHVIGALLAVLLGYLLGRRSRR